jgi:hypothetical protein
MLFAKLKSVFIGMPKPVIQIRRSCRISIFKSK